MSEVKKYTVCEQHANAGESLYENHEAPRFIRGHAVTLSVVLAAGAIFLFMMFYFIRKNKARQNGEEDHLVEGKTEEEINELGDESPRFLFTK